MAYIALVTLCGVCIGGFVKELSSANADLLIATAYILGAIVLGYMGAQIAPEVFKRK